MVLTLPIDDSRFGLAVDAQIRAVRGGRADIRGARRVLRQRFPAADLYRQRGVVVRAAKNELWFGYRDGRRSVNGPSESWWREGGVARAEIDAAGRLTRPNRAFRDLVGIRQRAGRGLLARECLPVAICDELIGSADWLRSVGEGASTATLRPYELDRRAVDFHAVWQGAGRARHVLRLRAVSERQIAQVAHAVEASSLARASKRERANAIQDAPPRELGPGERLTAPIRGDPWSILVVAGILRLYLAAGEVEPSVRYVTHGALIGTHLEPGDGIAQVGLQAVTPSVVLPVRPSVVQALMDSRPSFVRAVLNEGREELGEMGSAFAARASKTLPQRLAREILLLDALELREPLLPVTEQQLADGVGSIRESVARSLKSFRRRGWIATTRFGIIILDAAALSTFAEAV